LPMDPDARWFQATSATVHVKISDTETWDYPAEWGAERINRDIERRMDERVAKENEDRRKWFAQVPAARKAECHALSATTADNDLPKDCQDIIWGDNPIVEPSSILWNSPLQAIFEQVAAQTRPSAWAIIAAALPQIIGPPLAALALGAALLWAIAGFKR